VYRCRPSDLEVRTVHTVKPIITDVMWGQFLPSCVETSLKSRPRISASFGDVLFAIQLALGTRASRVPLFYPRCFFVSAMGPIWVASVDITAGLKRESAECELSNCCGMSCLLSVTGGCHVFKLLLSKPSCTEKYTLLAGTYRENIAFKVVMTSITTSTVNGQCEPANF
jgi:hypothetical protein